MHGLRTTCKTQMQRHLTQVTYKVEILVTLKGAFWESILKWPSWVVSHLCNEHRNLRLKIATLKCHKLTKATASRKLTSRISALRISMSYRMPPNPVVKPMSWVTSSDEDDMHRYTTGECLIGKDGGKHCEESHVTSFKKYGKYVVPWATQ